MSAPTTRLTWLGREWMVEDWRGINTPSDLDDPSNPVFIMREVDGYLLLRVRGTDTTAVESIGSLVDGKDTRQ